jgi:hypothetical protein
VGLAISVLLVVLYFLWSKTIPLGDLTHRYLNWGDYSGFWLGFYWRPDFTDLFAHHPDLPYLEAITPVGVKAIYGLLARLAVPLPIAHLGITLGLAISLTALIFGLTLTLLPIPFAGILASFLTLQSLWTPDRPLVPDPQTWGYVGILWCLYALNHRGMTPTLGLPTPPTPLTWSRPKIYWPLIGGILFLDCFFPRYLWIITGILIWQLGQRLAIVPRQPKPKTIQEFLDWSKEQQARRQDSKTGKKTRLKKRKQWEIKVKSARVQDIYLPGLILILGLAVLQGILHWGTHETFSRIEMLNKAEFYPGGLWTFFYSHLWQLWFLGERSGLIPLLTPPLLWSGLALLFWLNPWGLRQLPLLRRMTSGFEIMWELLIVSWLCFLFAHALILHLGWPQDFVTLSHRLFLTLSIAIFFTAIIESIVEATAQPKQWAWTILFFLTFIGISFRFSLIHWQPPANLLPAVPTSGLYQTIAATPDPKVLISTLDFQQNLSPENRYLLKALHTLAPFYSHPQNLSPDHQEKYTAQSQQLQRLIQAEYRDEEKEFIAFLKQIQGTPQTTPLWILASDSFTLEHWLNYPQFQNLYPSLTRTIRRQFSLEKISFLSEFVAKLRYHHSSCLQEEKGLIVVNLGTQCLNDLG